METYCCVTKVGF